MATEKEDLDQLLHAQGWLRFKSHLEREWSERFQQLIRTAVSDTNDSLALRKLQQVMVAKEAIEQAVQWPTQRLAELERAEQGRKDAAEPTMSRRGTL